MAMNSKVKLPCHEHPVYRSKGFNLMCFGCNRRCYNEEGYRCSKCYRDFFIHKECAESPEEISLPPHLHPHPLRLFGELRHYVYCYLCGERIRYLCYRCSECESYDVHIGCARNPPSWPTSLSIHRPQLHHHSLTFFGTSEWYVCDICRDYGFKCGYRCEECNFDIHMKCIDLSPEVSHPSHPSHLLKLLTDGAPNYSDSKCCLCGKFFRPWLYHCSICKYSICLNCVSDPPPLTLLTLKTHEHELTLLRRLISFICNACGEIGDRSPYVCLQCYFMFHRDCIDLPHVININRHHHCVCLTYRLGNGNFKWACQICCKDVDWSYGAYSCSICKDYVVHSRCAVSRIVWGGEELEGEREEVEDIEPFEMIADNVIKHFSHEEEEHNLVLNEDGAICEEQVVCKACINPIYSEPSYMCSMQGCGFVLHETCAKLPRKKWHVTCTIRLTLTPTMPSDKSSRDCFRCDVCHRYCSGFKYKSNDGILKLDIRCGSISEPLHHESHQHPLYYVPAKHVTCAACGSLTSYPQGMVCRNDDCDFGLHFGCAVLPEKVKHKSDAHTLSLCYGEEEEEASGEYWCDICEKVTDPKMWFYACDDCGTSLHIKCVLGDSRSLVPGTIIEGEYEVLLNNHVQRPRCYACGDICKFPKLLRKSDVTNRYFCSITCATATRYNKLRKFK